MPRRRQLTALFGAAALLLVAVGSLSAAARSEPTRRSVRIAATASTSPPTTSTTTAAPIAPRPTLPRRTVVFGDSLMHEARAFLAPDLAPNVVETGPIELHTYPMTAPCDFRDDIDHTLADPPSVAVFEFSGNAITTCMREADGSFPSPSELATRYFSDAASITDRFTAAGTTVLWVGAPRGQPGSGRTDQFAGAEPFTAPIYRATARAFRARGLDVRFVDAARAVLTDRGAWTASLPCAAADTAAGACAGGLAAVRAPDGAHFCPLGVTAADGTCPVWSSGAWRYADAVATAIRATA